MHLNTGVVQERAPYSEIGSELGILCAGLCSLTQSCVMPVLQSSSVYVQPAEYLSVVDKSVNVVYVFG
jgi:hypothetical protein